MDIPEHHPSCRPNDVTLQRVCGQCGLAVDASEVGEEIEALRAAINEIRKMAREGIDGVDLPNLKARDWKTLTDISLKCSEILGVTREEKK